MKGVGAVRNASARFASRGGRVVCVHGGGSVHAPAAGGGVGGQPCGSRKDGPSMRIVWH